VVYENTNDMRARAGAALVNEEAVVRRAKPAPGLHEYRGANQCRADKRSAEARHGAADGWFDRTV